MCVYYVGRSTQVDYRFFEGKTLSSICIAPGDLHKMIHIIEAQIFLDVLIFVGKF